MFKFNLITELLSSAPGKKGKFRRIILIGACLITTLTIDALTFETFLIGAEARSKSVNSQTTGRIKLKPESLADISTQHVYSSDTELSAKRGDQALNNNIASFNQKNIQDVFDLLLGHPRMNEARASVCAASFSVRVNKSAYYPKLNFTLSGGDKLVNKTTRSDEFGGSDSPEYDGKGLNAVLTLRQQVYDWGDTRSSINISSIERNKALLVRQQTLNSQAGNLLQASLEHESQERVREHWGKVIKALERHSEAVEARFKAGVGRIGDVREIQLITLEAQGEYDIAARRSQQAAEVLSRQYGLDKDQGRRLVKRFTDRRPDDLLTLPYEATLQGRIIELDRRSATYEYKRLQSRRLPKIEAVLIGRAWDINESNQCGELIPSTHPDYRDARGWNSFSTQPLPRFSNCNSHELVGSMEFSMPLYDGGANAAQRQEVKARESGLEAMRSAYIRDHQTETGYVVAQLNDYRLRAESLADQLESISQQLEGVLALQGKTQNDPLAVARLQSRQGQIEAQLILTAYQIENTHLEGLLRADALTKILAINPGDTGC